MKKHTRYGLLSAFTAIIAIFTLVASFAIRQSQKDYDAAQVIFSELALGIAVLLSGFIAIAIIRQRKRAESELADSQSWLEHTQSIAHLGSWIQDMGTNELKWSDESYRLFGLEPHAIKMTFETFLGMVHPDDRARVVEETKRAQESDDHEYKAEYRVIRPDGSERTIYEEATFSFDGQKGPKKNFYGYMLDITERKKTEMNLAERTELLGQFFNMPFIGMAITSPTSKHWVKFNDQLCAILGYSREELTEISWVQITYPEDIEADVAEFEHVMRGESEGYTMDKRFIRKDGVVIFATIDVKCVRKPDGALDYFVAMVQDITERKRLEKKIEENSAVLEKIFETTHFQVVFLDTECNFIRVNKAYADVCGFPPDYFIGKNHFALYPSEELESKFRRVIETGVPYFVHERPFEFPGQPEIGTTYWDLAVNPVIGADGIVDGLLFTLLEVTERKRAEEKLRANEERLKSIFSAMSEGFSVQDVITDDAGNPCDLRFVDANPAFELQTGLKNATTLGHTLLELFPTSEKYWIERYGHVGLTGEPIQFEAMFGPLNKFYSVNAFQTKPGQFGTMFKDISEYKKAMDALRASEYFFRESQKAGNIGSYKTDFVSGFWESSDVLDVIFGIDKNYQRTVTGWIDIVHPDDRETLSQYLSERVIAKREPFDKEYRIVRKLDQQVRWVRGLGQVTFDPDGKILSMTGTIQDITESRLMTEALAESEGRHRAIMENANDAMVCVDSKGEIYMWNKKAEQIFGYYEKEAMGKSVHDLIAPEKYRKQAEAGFSKFLASGEGPLLKKTTETTAIRRDGSEFPIELSIAQVKLKDGWGASAIVRDITEKKKTEQQILKLAGAIDQAHEGVLITDTDGRIEYANAGMEKLSGYTTQELIGQNSRIFKSGHQDAAFYKNLWDTVKGGNTWRGRLVNLKKGGDYYNEEMTVSPVIGDGGNISNFIAVKTDISEKLLLEKQLIQAEKLSTVGTFVSGVAHELNNPLTSILGYAAMLKDNEDLPEETREELRVISEQSKRVVDIVRNLLKFSRTSQDSVKPVSVNDVVQSVFELHGYRLRADNIVVERDLAKNIPPVNGNFTQLQQVLLNIVVNAHHEMVKQKGKGRLVARTSLSGDEAVVVIENDGPRIPEALIGKIFDPFFTTKESGEGTGLGLFVSYGIVKAHGGRIFCENMAEGGVRFTVALPIGHELDMPDSSVAIPSDKTVHNLRVLLVDDEEPIRKMATTAMTQRGMFTLSAAGVAEAIIILKAQEFDVIVSDIKMPVADGYALATWIMDNHPAMMKRLIFASGAIDQRMLNYCQTYGCHKLHKPYDGAELVKAVVAVAGGGYLIDSFAIAKSSKNNQSLFSGPAR